MKRAYVPMYVLVLVSMLMVAAFPPGVVNATNVGSGKLTPPKIATQNGVLTAVLDGATFVWATADTHWEHNTGKRNFNVFYVDDLRANTVLWDWGWCAKSERILEENWRRIALNFTVDGYSVPLRNFRTWDFDEEIEIQGLGVQPAKCRMIYGALYDWPAGDHKLAVTARFKSNVNDGWDVYPTGTIYEDIYRVKVLKRTIVEPTCDPNYSGYCVPIVSYDLDCKDVGSNFRVVGTDRHRFDGDGDRIACETSRKSSSNSGSSSTSSSSSSPRCDSNYSGYCVPIVSYDLDCKDVGSNFRVVGTDRHRFDGDGDGWCCER